MNVVQKVTTNPYVEHWMRKASGAGRVEIFTGEKNLVLLDKQIYEIAGDGKNMVSELQRIAAEHASNLCWSI